MRNFDRRLWGVLAGFAMVVIGLLGVTGQLPNNRVAIIALVLLALVFSAQAIWNSGSPS